MSFCTEFCTKLAATRLTDDVLPSYDELLEQLPATGVLNEWHLGTWQEIQQRSQCRFCQLVVVAILQSVQHVQGNDIDPSQPIDILLFHNEQSFRLLYPSPLGVRLSFVAEDKAQSPGPDTARRIPPQSTMLKRIRGWLRICDLKHDLCSRNVGTPADNKNQVNSNGNSE
jgi:hypothetical protein